MIKAGEFISSFSNFLKKECPGIAIVIDGSAVRKFSVINRKNIVLLIILCNDISSPFSSQRTFWNLCALFRIWFTDLI